MATPGSQFYRVRQNNLGSTHRAQVLSCSTQGDEEHLACFMPAERVDAEEYGIVGEEPSASEGSSGAQNEKK